MLLAELGWQSRPLSTVGVTSCHHRDGVSTIAAAIAKAAASMTSGTLLADVARLPDELASMPADGLDDVSISAELPSRPTGTPGLFTLSCDAILQSALSGASWTDGMGRLIDRLRNRYALCVFDLPPILDDARGAAIAAKLDTTVIVVRSDATSIEDVRRTERVLARNGVSLSGAILNRYRE
jgi:Mrp family chromosome partitioning ATPase